MSMIRIAIKGTNKAALIKVLASFNVNGASNLALHSFSKAIRKFGKSETRWSYVEVSIEKEFASV